MADTEARPRLRETIAGEIRVAMVRRQVTGAALALALKKSQAYVSRRLSGDTAFDVDDLEVIAVALNVRVADLIGHAERGDGAYVAGVDGRPNGRYVPLAELDLEEHPPFVSTFALAGQARPSPRALQRATDNSAPYQGI